MSGMAKDLYENSEIARELINMGDNILDFKLSEVMFNGPMEDLKQTDVTQPAIFLHSVVLLKILKNLIRGSRRRSFRWRVFGSCCGWCS